ncbi:N-acetylmuramidase domain-containing protein [Oricola sp.]|uniref:N-acetylmuramidase domain-containing protein n=1 Tax=Oricola sp. TaxID=1979950 RepID=UPI0025D95EF1|nr:N-acetylmuramidase domain-containing protein [Oricola sp.]MCI5074779.1 N-acetylmuramidase domain-containing protein [Oricola sp.]
MFSEETIRHIEATAREAGLEPAALLAIAEVESGGRAFAMVEGRPEPLIRFEGHYFDRLVDDAKRADARAKGLASPTAGAVKNPASQAARWRLLEAATAIDRDAALQSVSWGIGQVMGAHWKALGYASAEALVEEARSGAGGQTRLMLRFLQRNGLTDVIRAHDWATFARAYNGPGYRTHRYDSRIAAAYARHARGAKAPAGGAVLRRGDGGETVADLQRMLTATGYPLAPDGRFGPATARAVERFQSDLGLAVDGIVGPQTRAALETAVAGRPVPRRLLRLIAAIRPMLGVIARVVRMRAGRAA